MVTAGTGRGPRWVAALVAVLLPVAALAGATSAAAAERPTRSVWVQGDSVLVGAVEPVRSRLADWDATVGAFVGLSTRKGIEIFRDRQADLGSVVVVELGLNDWGMDSAGYGRLIDEAMGVLAGRHVIWLTSPRFRPEIDRVNDAIRAAASRHADYEVLEWGPISDAHPEATYSDRIHLRPAGQQLLAAAVGEALDRWWASVPKCDPPAGETETHNAVARLYHAYFLREPDQDGLHYWVPVYRSGAMCLTDVSEYFAGSPEFVAAYGALGVPEFVRRVYVNVLGREPDPDGYTYWADQLAYGGMRRGAMMVLFSESAEFRSRTGLVL